MRAQSWTDIMTLLAIMVASNKMDKRAELTMFEQAALQLRDRVAPNINLTESFAADWMTENKAEIDVQSSSVHFDASVKRLCRNLDNLVNKSEVLTLIMKWTLNDTPRETYLRLRYKAADETAFALAG